MFLYGKSVAVAYRPRTRIRPVGSQDARFSSVRQVGRQNLRAHPLAKLRIFQRKEYLDTFVQVPLHPIRASQINLRLPAVLEIKDAAVLQEAAHNAAHAD